MITRRFDRIHYFLFVIIFVFILVLHQRAPTDKEDIEFNIYESSRSGTNSSHKLVNYDRDVPLLWIGGVPRSGTTLCRAMLDAHPDIRCGEETRVIPRLLGMHTKMIGSHLEMSRLAEAHIDEPLLRDALASFILTVIGLYTSLCLSNDGLSDPVSLAGHGEMAPLLCNKDPFAIRSMSHIVKMFPRSKFVLMIRDARSVSHSIISRHVTIKGFDMKSYDGSLKDWNRAMGTMWETCKHSGPKVCLPVYYERLVLDPKGQMERMLKFLGVKWDDIVLHHEQAIGKKGGISLSKREPSTDQVNKAVNTDALSKWLEYIPKNVLDKIDDYAPLLSKLGYNTHQYPPDYTKLLDPIAERTMNI